VNPDAQILDYTVEIESLKLLIRKLRHMQFGNSSEKRGALDVEQLQLLVENLETAAAERSCELDQQTATKRAVRVPKPRREFAAHLPRETQTIAPQQSCCPDCDSGRHDAGVAAVERLASVKVTDARELGLSALKTTASPDHVSLHALSLAVLMLCNAAGPCQQKVRRPVA
jgi:hypothetical protein